MSRLVPWSKSCTDRDADTVLPAGQSPHRTDAVHGRGRRMLAGLHRGRSSDPKTTALEPNRSTGSSPPFRLPDRVAGHSPPAGGLALPGRCPPPIPPRRGPVRFGSGTGHRLVVGRLFHPPASSARVGHSGQRTGSCGSRGRVPAAAACQAEAGPVWPRSGAGLRSLQHTTRHGRGHPGPAAGSAIGRRRLRGIRLNQGFSRLARPQMDAREAPRGRRLVHRIPGPPGCHPEP